MRITIGNLRKIIRSELMSEIGGARSNAPRPVINNPMSPSMADREQLGRNSARDIDDPSEISPHLREPVYDEEDCWGPVPPTAEDPYALPDYYSKDYGVLPTPPIKR